MVTWWKRVLGEGAEGPDVALVQRKLLMVETGHYCTTTSAGVRGVQRQHGLPTTGLVDGPTALVLGEAEGAGLVPEWWNRHLRRGVHGPDVAVLRNRLALPPGEAFDTETENAVRRYQSGLGIWPDGRVSRALAISIGD